MGEQNASKSIPAPSIEEAATSTPLATQASLATFTITFASVRLATPVMASFAPQLILASTTTATTMPTASHTIRSLANRTTSASAKMATEETDTYATSTSTHALTLPAMVARSLSATLTPTATSCACANAQKALRKSTASANLPIHATTLTAASTRPATTAYARKRRRTHAANVAPTRTALQILMLTHTHASAPMATKETDSSAPSQKNAASTAHLERLADLANAHAALATGTTTEAENVLTSTNARSTRRVKADTIAIPTLHA